MALSRHSVHFVSGTVRGAICEMRLTDEHCPAGHRRSITITDLCTSVTHLQYFAVIPFPFRDKHGKSYDNYPDVGLSRCCRDSDRHKAVLSCLLLHQTQSDQLADGRTDEDADQIAGSDSQVGRNANEGPPARRNSPHFGMGVTRIDKIWPGKLIVQDMAEYLKTRSLGLLFH